ncbi:tetratricopeptide repeat protein [Methylocapsa sp. S129]|uniref:tetratricopeptide repeat protein n=1 Tax=Methylocapsa sp. S129 TaxID=1641869 RepID=UPI00131E8383|nr:tetratricopeptide repeat protein [Methylocapsa sp. S129]
MTSGEGVERSDVEVAAAARSASADAVEHSDALPKQDVAALVSFGHSLLAGADPAGALEVFQEARALAPDNLAIHNEIAYLLRRLGRADEAETIFRAILRAAPAHAGALAGLGYLLRARGVHVEALTAFEEALATGHGDLDLKIEVAHELRALRRFDEAERAYRDALVIAPGRADALIGLAQALRERGDLGGALSAFEAAAQVNPHNLEARNAIGYLLRQMKRPSEAEAVFASIVSNAPGHGGALVGLGYIRGERGDYEEALAAFEAAAAHDAHNPAIRIQIAHLLRKMDRPDEAEAMFHRVLDDAPNSVSAMIEMAKLKKSRGDRAGAMAIFATAIEKSPGSAGLRVEFGYLLREIGRAEEAREAFDAALKSEPLGAPALCGLGWLMVDVYRLDEAQAYFSQALEANRRDPAPRLALGHVARRRGDRTASLAFFESVLGVEPENIDAKLERAVELRDRGAFVEAREMIESVLVANPKHVSARLQFAQLEERLGDSAAALRTVQVALTTSPRHPSALLAAARANRNLGKPHEAQDIIRRALEQDPNNLEALIDLADSTMAAEDFGGARAVAWAAIAAHPHQVWPYLQAARAAAQSGDAAEASEILDDALRQCGSQPEIVATRVQLARQARDWPAAREALARASCDFAGSFFLWSETMLVAIAIGDFASGEAALARAPVSSTKDQARVRLFRAQMLEAQRRYDEAIAEYRAAAQLDPADSWTHGELARACLIGLELDAALDALRMSVHLDASGHILRGQSLNASQHPLGQIIDEFLLDREILRELQDARRLPVADRLALLSDVVRRNPSQTAPAIMLLIALRQSGQFAQSASDRHDEAAPTIPRRIVQFWDSAEPPRDIQDIMRSWRDKHPDFAYRLFDDASAKAFLISRFPIDVVRAFMRARHPAQRADIFRLAYLSAEGGFYIDADDRCLAPIATFAPAGASLALYQENYGTIGNDFIGAMSGHPIIARALVMAVEAMNRGDSDTLWLSTGPGLFTRAFAQVVVETPDWRRGTIVRELDAAQRAIGLHCPVCYKQTNKHWTRAARRNIAAVSK